MDSSRYVVVGAGLAGAATAYSLSRRGFEVTLVERDRPAAHDGSSHGSARIFRYGYPDRFYTDLVIRARQGFDELEQAGDVQLITPTGSLDFGTTRDPIGLARVLSAAGVEHELLGRDQARSRWPQIAFDTDVLWHPDAGVIDAETTVLTQVRLARSHGASVLTEWDLSRVTRDGAGYRLVSTDGRQLAAENVIVTAGGWLPTLLDNLQLPSAFLQQIPQLQVSQEQAYHFPYRNPQDQETFPTFIHKRPGFQTYSLPGGRDADFRGQKLAEYNAGLKLRSAVDQTGLIDPVNRARIVSYVHEYLPGLVPEPYAETTCLFTNTPTEDFILDRAEGITLVSPCSGHGAKFSPLIGELAADIATGGTGPDRFTVAHLSSSSGRLTEGATARV